MKGVLLVNLGTPDAPEPTEVGRYLREFLSDPRVVDLPRWMWLPLLNLAIIPLRRRRSAVAYRKIWTESGSPLRVNSHNLANKLGKTLEGEAEVRLAMRYGKPSIASAMAQMRELGVARLVVLPLYPQYSATTTESAFDAVGDAMRDMQWFPEIHSIEDYHINPDWVEAVANSILCFQANHGRPQQLMFSLHGIPRRYSEAGDPYASQCERSVAAVAHTLSLNDGEFLITYQSRFGREPWLQPYTDKILKELAENGVRHVQVVCPGFAVDCLETLEEIAIQNRELFLKNGGEKLEYIPALNDSRPQVQLLAGLVRGKLS